MRFAVLPVYVSDQPRVTALTRDWIERACALVKRYIEEQSSGREIPYFKVFDWYRLSLTAQQWKNLGKNVSDTVNEEIKKNRHYDLSDFDMFVYIIDIGNSLLGERNDNEIRIEARDFDPSLLAHLLVSVYGAGPSYLDKPDGPEAYGGSFCIMGAENAKHSFRDMSLVSPKDGADETHTDCGPGMCVPTLLATGWMDLTNHAAEIKGSTSGLSNSTFRIHYLDGAPNLAHPTVCYFVDYGDRYFVEYRNPKTRWNQGLPPSENGWLVVHRTPLDGPLVTLEVASLEAIPGKTVALTDPNFIYPLGAGPLKLSVVEVDPPAGTVVIRFSLQPAKIPQYMRPFEVPLSKDEYVLWTPEFGWRTFAKTSEMADVIRKLAELDEIQQLIRVSERNYVNDLTHAGEQQKAILHEAISRIKARSTY